METRRRAKAKQECTAMFDYYKPPAVNIKYPGLILRKVGSYSLAPVNCRPYERGRPNWAVTVGNGVMVVIEVLEGGASSS
jgi:hypothetical protein